MKVFGLSSPLIKQYNKMNNNDMNSNYNQNNNDNYKKSSI